MSDVVIKESSLSSDKFSHMAIAFQGIVQEIGDTEPKGLYRQRVIVKTGGVTIDNDELDVEFNVSFDDDVEANECKIVIYNLTNRTINAMQLDSKITITAGYGDDVGVIFSGYISSRTTKTDSCDKITTIYAIDDMSRQEKDVESISYAKGKTASYILKDLCERTGLPIAVFNPKRDHTYQDEVTVDGGLMENIKRYAKVCGVSAYICKSQIYVRPLTEGDNTSFTLKSATGLLSVAEFEEQETNEEYEDITKGFDLEMLLQHRIQTASIINLQSKDATGTFRVKSGTHEYDGSNFITKVRAIYG